MDHAKFSPDDVRIRPEVGLPTIQAFDDPVTGWTTLRIYTQFDLGKEYTVSLRGTWRTIDGAQVGNMPYRIRFKTVQFYEFKPYSGRKE